MLIFIFNRFLAGRYSANICSLVWQRTCIFWRLLETACSCTCWWEQIISSDCNFTMLRHTYFLGSWFLQTLNLTLNQSEPSVVTWKSPGAAATQFAVWRQTEMVGKPIICRDDIYSALPAQVIAGRGNELFPLLAKMLRPHALIEGSSVFPRAEYLPPEIMFVPNHSFDFSFITAAVCICTKYQDQYQYLC